MTGLEFAELFAQFCLLSLLSIGGYVTVLPDVHRHLVEQRQWLDEAGFAQAVALGQSAPGPNILVIGVLGWAAAGPLGLVACLGGILLPSSLLVLRVGRWARANREHALQRAFQTGSAPLVLGLSLASAALLATPFLHAVSAWLLLLGVALATIQAPRVPPVAWIALGALAGALGLI